MCQRKIFNTVAYSSLIITFLIMMLIGFWTFYPNKIIEIKNSDKIKVDKTEYRPGDRVTYTIEYCKFINAPANVLRSLVDGIRINYVPYYNNLQKGCGTVNNADLIIPEFVSPGTYHFETTIEFKPNPIRTVIVTWRSVDFLVIN
jgi:hypothetical protein